MNKEEKVHRPVKKAEILKLFSVLLSLAMLVVSCVFLTEAPKIIVMLIFLAFASFGVIIPSIDAKKHESWLKIFFVALISVTLFLVAYIILEATGVIEQIENVNVMIEMIRSTGQLGIIVFILLILVNVIFLPIPPAVPAVIGTVLYGPLWSFIYMAIGTVAGSIITFIIGRIFGKKVVIWMIGKEKTEKYAKFLDEKGRLAFIFMMIFPFFPDDILCLIAGMTHMSYLYFISVICTTRTIVLAFMCFFADGSIIPFHGWGIPVWITIGVVLVAAFIVATLVKKRMMNKKDGKSEKEKKSEKSTA